MYPPWAIPNDPRIALANMNAIFPKKGGIMNYTKGDWKIEFNRNSRWFPFKLYKNHGVETELVAGTRTKANAHLIAAAPDMYEALVQIIYTKPKSPIRDCPADISSNPCICGWHDAMKIGEKALSKAEGREE